MGRNSGGRGRGARGRRTKKGTTDWTDYTDQDEYEDEKVGGKDNRCARASSSLQPVASSLLDELVLGVADG
jgi:hypothetical protein